MATKPKQQKPEDLVADAIDRAASALVVRIDAVTDRLADGRATTPARQHEILEVLATALRGLESVLETIG